MATWWCGEPAALDEVLARIDRLVIKAAFPQLRIEPVFGDELSERGRRQMRDDGAQPAAACTSRRSCVHLSQAPVVNPHQPRQLASRVIGLRVFACATPNGYR